MNNQSSYCGLFDKKIRASGKELPVQLNIMDEISIFTFDNTILRFTRIQQRKERK